MITNGLSGSVDLGREVAPLEPEVVDALLDGLGVVRFGNLSLWGGPCHPVSLGEALVGASSFYRKRFRQRQISGVADLISEARRWDTPGKLSPQRQLDDQGRVGRGARALWRESEGAPHRFDDQGGDWGVQIPTSRDCRESERDGDFPSEVIHLFVGGWGSIGCGHGLRLRMTTGRRVQRRCGPFAGSLRWMGTSLRSLFLSHPSG